MTPLSPESVSSTPWPSGGLLCIPVQIVRNGPQAGRLDTGVLGLGRAVPERATGLKQGLAWTLREGLQNHVVQAPAPPPCVYTCVHTDMYTHRPTSRDTRTHLHRTLTHTLSDARTYLHRHTHTPTLPHLVMHAHTHTQLHMPTPTQVWSREGSVGPTPAVSSHMSTQSGRAQHPLWTFGDVS